MASFSTIPLRTLFNRYLAPIQMGDKEAGEILIVSRDAAEAYFAMEDEAVGMAECRMM